MNTQEKKAPDYDPELEYQIQEAINQLKGIKKNPIVRETPKIGRNEACPCGSGKKNKKCCKV